MFWDPFRSRAAFDHESFPGVPLGRALLSKAESLALWFVRKDFSGRDNTFVNPASTNQFTNVLSFWCSRCRARAEAAISSTTAARPCLSCCEDCCSSPSRPVVTVGVACAFGEGRARRRHSPLFLELILIPHGVGDAPVEGLRPIALANLGLRRCRDRINTSPSIVV